MAVDTKPSDKSANRPRNRRAIAREERRKRQQRQRLITTVAGVVIVAVLGFLAVRAIASPRPGQAVASLGNAHIDQSQVGTISYNTTPPTSGPHLNQIARWGIHTEPVPNELQVHNLEDGGVMVQYSCPDGCDELVAQLSDVVDGYSDHIILAPYPDMDTRIALTAWGRIDKFDEFDEDRVNRFIRAYRGIDNHVR